MESISIAKVTAVRKIAQPEMERLDVPQLPPKRPAGFYEKVLLQWRMIGQTHGLSDTETVQLGAHLTGLAVAAAGLSPEGSERLLTHANDVAHTSYFGRIAIVNGFGHPAIEKS